MAQSIRIRVLVIDDEEALCRRLGDWLRAERYDPAVFTNADEALTNAERISYHAALVDLRLADVDGTEVVARLRRASPRTCVLAMTAFPEAAQVIAAFRAGARDLLEKPIQREPLLGVLERHLADAGVVALDEQTFNARFGRRLRSVRQQAELTAQELAEAAGITAAQLSQIELGKTATTTWTLARICAALRVPLHECLRDL